MGADLYINSLLERQRRQWSPELESWVRQLDNLETGSEEHQRVQARIDECYEKLYERGYFRDPYNNWDLLWQFGLSWWNDVIPMLDEDSRLTVAAATRLMAMLTEREDVFAERLLALTEKDEQYFRHRYIELRQFLNQAVALGEPIDCSL